MPQMYDAQAADTATAAANTAVTITYAAARHAGYAIKEIIADYSATPTGGLVTISEGGTVVRRFPVPGTSRTITFPDGGLRFDRNSEVVITLAAGSGSVVGYLNVIRMAVAS